MDNIQERRTRRQYGNSPECDAFEPHESCGRPATIMFHLAVDDPEVMINTAFACPDCAPAFLTSRAAAGTVMVLLDDNLN